MKIEDGKILLYEGELKSGYSEGFEDTQEIAYQIKGMNVDFSEDIRDVIGVVRCTGVSLETDAPDDIRRKAELLVMNMLADIEYNCADGGEFFIQDAKEDISKLTGIKESCIVVS